jgi:hypothetical protein
MMTDMSQAKPHSDLETETERQLLEAAVAEARADTRLPVPHDEVRAGMLREIERLKRKTAGH